MATGSKLHRTGDTSLGDDALLLLDFLALQDAAPDVMWRGCYAVHMDCNYTHSLEADAMRACLDDLVDQGLIRWDPEQPLRRWDSPLQMTRLGGTAWVAERRPVWHRFVSHHVEQPRDSSTFFQVESPVLELAERFLEVARETGRVCPPDAVARPVAPYWLEHMAGKFTLPGQHAMRLRADYGQDWDRETWAARCTWWSNVPRMIQDGF